MEAGASLMTLIVLALQSIKFIYETVSGIRDGPKQIQELAAEIKALEAILSQLESSSIVGEGAGHPSYTEIKQLIINCCEDVSRYEELLKKLEPSDSEKKLGLLWRRVKTVLKEKDIQRLLNAIQRYVGKLGMNFNLLQG